MSDWTVEEKLYAVMSAAAPLIAFACAASFFGDLGAVSAVGPKAFFSAAGAVYFLIMVGAATHNLSNLAARAETGERVSRARRLAFASLAGLGAACMAIAIIA